jgi:hypothetical protein
VPAAVIAIVALGELYSACGYQGAGADEEDWQAVRELFAERHRPGELIVFAPGWIDPLGRHHLGDSMTVEMAARMDAARFPVIWEVSQGGAEAPEVQGKSADDTWELGDLRVRRFERVARQLVYDFTSEVAGARIEGPAVGRPARRLEEVGFEPHYCVRAEVRPGGKLVIEYPDAKLGKELVGYVGLADVFTRRDIRSPGWLSVSIDGDEVARTRAGIDDGWVGFRIETEPDDAAVVRFTVEAREPRRLVCFAAEARR